MRDPAAGRDALLEFIAADPALASLLAESRARDAARTPPDPAHDTEHALRVALWTLRLGAGGVHAREAVAAALLHDAVTRPKDSPERSLASTLAADAARVRLAALGFASGVIERIAGAIRDHSFSRGATPDGPLGDALQDADRLEALGALGLLRCISTGVRMNGAWFDADDPWARARELDDARYALDHLFTKLFKLPGTMRTAAGRAEAEHRAAFLRVFVEQLASETNPSGAEPPGARRPIAR